MDSAVASILKAKQPLQGQSARAVLPQLERARGLIAEERTIVDSALNSALRTTGGAPEPEKPARAAPPQPLSSKEEPIHLAPQTHLEAQDPSQPQYLDSHTTLRSLRPLPAASGALPPHSFGGDWYLRQVFGSA